MPRRRTISLLNKLIDQGDGKLYPHSVDLVLHFVNEAVIHGDPGLFVKNFLRYEAPHHVKIGRRRK
ncbi:MAG: hypothetical protein QW429_06840 [Thermoprotei archaeon]